MTAAGEIFDNRAVGAVIAVAGIRQCQQLVAHGLQLLNVSFDLRHLLQRAPFDVGAVPLRVVKQIHQLAALFGLKPTCRARRSKGQFVEMLLRVGAITVFAAHRRRHQPLLFIEANGFAGQAGNFATSLMFIVRATPPVLC